MTGTKCDRNKMRLVTILCDVGVSGKSKKASSKYICIIISQLVYVVATKFQRLGVAATPMFLGFSFTMRPSVQILWYV